jgi:hypothetical protein
MAGAGGVVHIPWYSTVLRKDLFAAAVVEASPLCLRYGATRYAVHQSRDDMYKITQMMWFPSQSDWYRFWEGPEMTEFRRRFAGKYQIPITYIWHTELAAGELGPQVDLNGTPAPEPETAPEALA